MSFAPVAGPSGAVLVGGVAYAFGKWRISIKAALPRVNNFTSAYQLVVGGLWSGTLTLDGPYDAGNMPLTAGTQYTFTLKFDNAHTLSIPAVVGEITPSQDIEDAGRVSVTAETNGTFTVSIA